MGNTINDYIEDIKAYTEGMEDDREMDHEVLSGVLCALRTAARHCREVYTEKELARLTEADREAHRLATAAKNAAYWQF